MTRRPRIYGFTFRDAGGNLMLRDGYTTAKAAEADIPRVLAREEGIRAEAEAAAAAAKAAAAAAEEARRAEERRKAEEEAERATWARTIDAGLFRPKPWTFEPTPEAPAPEAPAPAPAPITSAAPISAPRNLEEEVAAALDIKTNAHAHPPQPAESVRAWAKQWFPDHWRRVQNIIGNDKELKEKWRAAGGGEIKPRGRRGFVTP
jgi:hypothetical protein